MSVSRGQSQYLWKNKILKYWFIDEASSTYVHFTDCQTLFFNCNSYNNKRPKNRGPSPFTTDSNVMFDFNFVKNLCVV